MSYHEPAITVAIVNTNPDLVRLLRVNLEAAGFVVTILHIEEIKAGEADAEAFLRLHDPQIIVYDVPPPFELNWRTMEHIRHAEAFQGRQFVLTTMNLNAMQRIIGPDETVCEVIGEAEDISNVVRAVKEASRSRPTR